MGRRAAPAGVFAAMLIAGFLFSWLWVRRVSVEDLEHVRQADYRDGILYGIDMQEQDYFVFRIGLESGEGEGVRVPMSDGGRGTELTCMAAAGSGTLYVLASYSDGKDIHRDIMVCDFERRRLEPAAHLEQFADRDVRAILPYQDGIQIVCRNSHGELELWALEGDKFCLLGRYPKISDGNVLYFVTETSEVFVALEDGRICRVDEEGNTERIFQNQGSREDGWNQNIRFCQDEVFFENSLSHQRYRIDLSKRPYRAVSWENPYWPVKSFQAERFQAGMQDRDGIRYGILSLEDGRSVAAVCGAVEYVAEQVCWPAEKKLMAQVFLFLGFVGAELLLWGIWRYLKRKEIAVPLVVETAVLAAVVMAAGTEWIEGRVFSAVRENIEESSREACIRAGTEYMDTYLPENVRIMSNFHKITDKNRIPLRYDYAKYGRIEDSVFSDLRFELLVKKEDGIYALESFQYMPGIPLPYNYGLCSYEVFDSVRKAADEGAAVFLKNEMVDQQACLLFLPFSLSECRYPLVLGVELSLSQMNQMIARQSMEIRRILYGVSGVFMVSVLFLIWLGMRPLKALKQAALQVAEGKPGVQVKVWGRSEAAVTARYFNHMSEQIGVQIRGIRQYQKKYAAFFPFWFLPGEEKRDESHGYVGDFESGKEYPVMALGFLQEKFSGYPGANPDTGRIIRLIHQGRGDVIGFEEYGLRCMFLEEPQAALNSAMKIIKFAEEQGYKLCIAIGTEKLSLGITGNSSRSRVTACHMDGDISWFLKDWGEERGIPLLMTGKAAGRIPGFFAEYHYRLLGRIRMNHGMRTEPVYEVLDGEDGWQQRKKLLTEGTFAAGREAFQNGDFTAARMAFIQVYSENPQDGAALHYIRLCEKNNVLPDGEKQCDMEVWKL